MQTNERPQYISQINAFHRFTEGYYLPTNAQLLWFKLIDLCNTCGWPEWVQVDADRIARWIGAANEKTAYRARDALVKAGLLEYQKGCRGCPNRYRLRYFTLAPYGAGLCANHTEVDPEVNAVPNDGLNMVPNDGVNSGVNDGVIIRQDIEQTRQEREGVPAELSQALGAYAQMRKKMRRPLTDSGQQLVLRKLDKLAPDRRDEQRRILEQSILNGWTDVYPLKQEEAPEPPASYDIGEFERRLLYGKIEYKKRL